MTHFAHIATNVFGVCGLEFSVVLDLVVVVGRPLSGRTRDAYEMLLTAFGLTNFHQTWRATWNYAIQIAGEGLALTEHI